MIKILNRLGVRTKLLISFILLASFVFILGVTAIIIQKKLKKNQIETLSGIRIADAYFEAKYFMRSDMHIFTVLIKTNNEERLNYWWGEHEFQIQFFGDQLQKIEKQFLGERRIKNDTLESKMLALVSAIQNNYERQMLLLFNKFMALKTDELELLNALSNPSDSNINVGLIDKKLKHIQSKYNDLNQKVTAIGLNIITDLDAGKDIIRVLIEDIEADGLKLMDRIYKIFLFITILGVLFSVIIAWYTSLLITRPVNSILNHVDKLGKGEHPDNMKIMVHDEFGTIQDSLNQLTQALISTSEFSREIGDGNFDSAYHPMSDNDVLGNSLLSMRESLKKAREEELKRREEDEKVAWTTNGLAKFSDILRQSGDSLKNLGFSLMSNMIDYLDAVQGALFVINDEDSEDVYFELISAIAYSREKNMQKQIKIGEGLVGRVAYEEKTIYLKEIPENYVKITSGLGTSNPRTLLLVPVKLEDKVNGVIELVSFKELEPYQISFVEKVGETIASFIASIKINEKTAMLLSDSQHKSEELAAQEEEMRQNMEELQATQEEAARRENERNMLWDALGKITGIIETDLNGTIIDANERIASIMGLSIPEITGKNYKETFLLHTNSDGISLWSSVTQGNLETIQIHMETQRGMVDMKHQLTLLNDLHGNAKKVLIVIQSE